MATAYVERVIVLNEKEKEVLKKATEILRQVYNGFGNEFADDNIPLRFYENSEEIEDLLAMANNFPEE